MKEEDLKTIASLVNWSDKLLSKVFCETYGKLLQKKFEEFEECKKQLKECVVKNFGAGKLAKTPRRMNPATKLFEQIQHFKVMNFDSDDENLSITEEKKQSLKLPQLLQQIRNIELQQCSKEQELNKKNVETPKFGNAFTLSHSLQKSVQNKIEEKKTYGYPESSTLERTPKWKKLKATSQIPRNKLLEDFKKEEQRKMLEEKAKLALKHKEEYLKDKAERTKREREERQRRVEENNRLKEAKQQEREKQQRIYDERLRKFRQEQENLEKNGCSLRSPAAKTRKLGTPRQQPLSALTNFGASASNVLQDSNHSNELNDNNGLVHNVLETNNQKNTLLNAPDAALIKDTNRKSTDLSYRNNSENEKNLQDCKENVPKISNQKSSIELRKLENKENFARKITDTTMEIEEVYDQKSSLTKCTNNIQNNSHEIQENKSIGCRGDEESPHFRTANEADFLRHSSNSVLSNNMHTPQPQVKTETKPKHVSYEITPDKVPLPSTKENYVIDDLSSGDETDNEEAPKKIIPNWAQKSMLLRRVAMLRKLLTEEQRERHFGKIAQPTVQTFFSKYQKEYPIRSSSAIWNSPMSDPTPGIGRTIR